MAIRIYGSSDDNFCFEGRKGADEIDCFEKAAEIQIGTIETGGALIVRGEYVDPGVWTIGIRPLDEDIPFPIWPIQYELDRPYSPALIIDCPDDTPYGPIKDMDPEYQQYKRLKEKFG